MDVQGDGMLFRDRQGGLPPQAPEVRKQVPRTTLKNPDVFTGVREKAERWYTDMDDWFANAQTAPERQLGLAKSYLSPELKDWFDLVKLEDGIGFCDWPALKNTLLRRYRDKHVCRAAKKKIAILRCTRTVSDYNNKFDVEALKLKKAGTSEWDLLDSYIEGLPPAVMFQTDRQELQTLQEAMEKALDNEAWLQQALTRGGKWAKGAGLIPGGSPPINPTGPAPMELCGVRRSMPFCDPRLPQALWEERWRRRLCLRCGDPNHQMRQCWNGLRGPPPSPPQACAMYTSPFGGWREPPQRAARFSEFRQESSPPRRYYEGARYPSPSGSPSAAGGREETCQPGRGFGSNVPLGGQGRTFSDTPSFGRRTSSPPRGS
uniref:Retrotransposon gag domain-containing protein n=1 Tax=Chromera velia CCMP2878 TaxID=1169474 RepID=A0A0G4IEV0_9ALVE|eukprot:Cvel_13847.t1-p1 / transcript=Cvel_13847.t1 / gene=Cvel_13847 / organism=Chromera_velia_CCMP2878 / gene_product=hypothetical protein / transcript_product=hypothetical protein / location=Cvel_scaffold962:17311-18432(+) / protein_length=374 / sequence_SO=supercontig / SO=protein_coding / is_pseudo=false